MFEYIVLGCSYSVPVHGNGHIDDPNKIIVTVTYVTATREFAHNYKLYYYTAATLSFYQLLLC